jgi:hypothetical protein
MSAPISPIKEATPASDAKSFIEKAAVTFTDKEERVMKIAWSCLKSGPPEVDYEKLMKAADFKTQKVSLSLASEIKSAPKLTQMTDLPEHLGCDQEEAGCHHLWGWRDRPT